jgi:hypothetical protein
VETPWLLYFDANNKLQAGHWSMQVNATNIAFFQFGSVVGFTFTDMSDDWGSGDIKFNPTITPNSVWEADVAGYQAIPAWSNYTGTKPSTYSITTNDDYISSSSYHTLANAKLGYGDPCQLVGYTGAEINSLSTLPPATYRLPTNPENNAFVGYSGTAGVATNIGTTYGTWTLGSPGYMTFPKSSSTNQILPGVGLRDADSSPDRWGLLGVYWSSTPADSTFGYYIHFDSGSVIPSYAGTTLWGFAIRCVTK